MPHARLSVAKRGFVLLTLMSPCLSVLVRWAQAPVVSTQNLGAAPVTMALLPDAAGKDLVFPNLVDEELEGVGCSLP